MNLPLKISDIKNAVGRVAFQRGHDYQQIGRVRGIHWCEEGHLHGKVKGNSRIPYEQEITIELFEDSSFSGNSLIAIKGECSCPVEFNCKHVAAVLLQLLENNIEEEAKKKREAIERRVIPIRRDYQSLENPSVQPTTSPSFAAPELNRDLSQWVERAQLYFRAAPTTGEKKPPPELKKRLHFALSVQEFSSGDNLEIKIFIMKPLKAGGFSTNKKELRLNSALNESDLEAMTQQDFSILGQIGFYNSRISYYSNYRIPPEQTAGLLESLLATGRVFWEHPEGIPLKKGPDQEALPNWQRDKDGVHHLKIGPKDQNWILLPGEPPWYADLKTGLCGQVKTSLSTTQLTALSHLPPLEDQEAPLLRSAMQRLLPDAPAWWPAATEKDLPQRTPTPILRLFQKEVKLPGRMVISDGRYKALPGIDLKQPVAQLTMNYDGVKVSALDTQMALQDLSGEHPKWFTRDGVFEQRALERCRVWGFIPHPSNDAKTSDPILIFKNSMPGFYSIENETGPDPLLLNFLYDEVPRLKEEGWEVEVDDIFPVVLAEMDDDLTLELEEGSGIDWFGLELGVTVDGERLSLLPLLIPQLATLSAGMNEEGDTSSENQKENLFVPLPDGRHLPVPIERLGPLLNLLREWYGLELPEGNSVRLPTALAGGLVAIQEAGKAAGLRWHGADRLLEMGRRLRSFDGITTVKPPSTFKGKLRPYQQEGLSWMQFLREYGFGGILADDMGLGKTVQTLAHLLVEKKSGRMDRPSLVIAPTSLMANWRLETERFAPSLKTLTLHGKERAEQYDQMANVDLVFTTYALAYRDEEILMAQPWHLLILDEAHYIKNPSTKVALVVQRLVARHRLCLTGTPMENHLGELWSLMHFLMPGILGNKTRFVRYFKTPIEKQGHTIRQQELMQRVKPFVLRRLKSAVEKDLPPKTEIVERIMLEGSQVDLYETLRLAMHNKVRQEMAKKGLSKSHITILDALLKLRQVCCDPRLVKLESARKVNQSAKFERLFEMLPEMVEEGRRILLFSQFTSMLDLLEPELKKREITYLKLTGQTKDRAPIIEAFQKGEAPVFLLSLKAGGVGLNLTAADTVIHYDPWWNPAVEAQATDRAHRLGQDKAVFVYKLITLNTVEEKILQLQEKKQALVESLLDPTAKSAAKITQEDVEWLFSV